ncbi:hypothetical protein GCM10011351_09110 [Paraliobacillus quinghaiensis]|uniref:PucR C-terminal helix-turn-helix domain-containing protein n=1 Tax=Paraliobacillus quinghaiensis TaxID=470815 RepID=A0A917TJK9_9BACI|nr:helix-turn-helix domain-containing protein [Paraliobacillus quinghaiensis]GGM25602.1 hypothetical protein GCM10011351_09110 [Paraliobacillus quinghaiensis]
MLDKLKKIFPTLIEGQINQSNLSKHYAWYLTPDSLLIGIDKEQIGPKEKEILDVFLQPYEATQTPLTKNEEKWNQLIFNQKLPIWKDKPKVYRFVYFSLSDDLIEADAFKEAIHGIFPTHTPILWENNREGIIIEETKPPLDEEIDYNNMIDVFMSDFYLDLHLFVGPFFRNLEKAPTYYQWVKKCSHFLRKFNKGPVINYVSGAPYLLIEASSEADYSILIDAILQETNDDEELLKTIQVFLESNSNTSLAAKKMYMHRNSLQYRIDKFIERTGIDVKQFDGALSVYLTLLLKHKMKHGM